MDRNLGCKIYESELIRLGFGVPLYDPKPPGNYHVHIGDVGYRQNGQFQSVFNAFSNSDTTRTLNQGNGTPEGFRPMLPQYTTTIDGTPAVAGSVFKTLDAQSIEGDLGLDLWSSAPVGPMVQLSLSQKKECAALLSIRHSATCTSAQSKWEFKRYMLEHFQSWFSFIRDRLDWATGVWAQSAFRGEARLNILETFLARLSTTRRVSVSIPTRYGPDPDRTLASLRNQSEVALVGENEIHRDQCIFVKCFWVKERPLLGIKMEAAAEPQDLDMDRDADSPPKVLSTDSWLELDEDDYKEEPHEFALNIILEHSNADIAIVHESDVFALAGAIGHNFTRPLDIHVSLLQYKGSPMGIVTYFDSTTKKTVATLKHKDDQTEDLPIPARRTETEPVSSHHSNHPITDPLKFIPGTPTHSRTSTPNQRFTDEVMVQHHVNPSKFIWTSTLTPTSLEITGGHPVRRQSCKSCTETRCKCERQNIQDSCNRCLSNGINCVTDPPKNASKNSNQRT